MRGLRRPPLAARFAAAFAACVADALRAAALDFGGAAACARASRPRPWRLRAAGRRRRRRRMSPGATPLDRRDLAFGRPELHRAHRRRVLVVLDHVDEGALRAALDRGRRDQRRVLERLEQHAHVDELVREERAVVVRRTRALSLTVPVVGSIWLSTVSSLPVGELVASARGPRPRPRCASPRCSRFSTRGRLSCGEREDDADRLQLRDHDEAVRVARAHDVAGIDLAQADAAADRRGDRRVGELQLRVVDLRPGRPSPRLRTGAPAPPGCRPAASRSSPARAACGSARGRSARSASSAWSLRELALGLRRAAPGTAAGRSRRAARPALTSWPSLKRNAASAGRRRAAAR